jgi:hypothetical protein
MWRTIFVTRLKIVQCLHKQIKRACRIGAGRDRAAEHQAKFEGLGTHGSCGGQPPHFVLIQDRRVVHEAVVH